MAKGAAGTHARNALPVRRAILGIAGGRSMAGRWRGRVFRSRCGESDALHIMQSRFPSFALNRKDQPTKRQLSIINMSNQISDYLSKIGRKGAKTRWEQMSKQERAKEMSRRRRLGMERRKEKGAQASESDRG